MSTTSLCPANYCVQNLTMSTITLCQHLPKCTPVQCSAVISCCARRSSIFFLQAETKSELAGNTVAIFLFAFTPESNQIYSKVRYLFRIRIGLQSGISVFHMNLTSFKRSLVLKDHFFFVPKVTSSIENLLIAT